MSHKCLNLRLDNGGFDADAVRVAVEHAVRVSAIAVHVLHPLFHTHKLDSKLSKHYYRRVSFPINNLLKTFLCDSSPYSYMTAFRR